MIRFPRVPDFEARLSAVLDDARHKPMVWGQHDCVLFAFRAVQALGGPDLLEMTPGGWDERSGRALLHFFGGLERCVAAYAIWSGVVSVAPALALRGDFGVIKNGTDPAACLVLGAGVAVTGQHGLIIRPRSALLRAWAW